MSSKSSKAKRPAPTKTKAVTIPRIPQDTVSVPSQGTFPAIPQDTVPIPSPGIVPVPLQGIIPIPRIPHDIINEILNHLASDSDPRTLRACALVSGSWVQPCQRHLFHTAVFTPKSARKWLRTFPVQEESPAHHVRDIRLEIGWYIHIPEKFFECIPWFTHVDRMTFSGHGGGALVYSGLSPLWEPSCWKLPRSVTSLTIHTRVVTLVQVRDIMAQLPNLDNLAVSGCLAEVNRRRLPGIGTVLKGRLGGRLMLHEASEDVVNMLLEIPSGPRFTELEFDCTYTRLPSSAVQLAEACGKVLVKLSYTLGYHCKSYPFSYSGLF